MWRARLERGIQAFLLIFVIVFLGWLWIKPNGVVALRWFIDVTTTLTGVLGGLIILIVAHYIPKPSRRSWRLLGAGVLSWGFGEVVWTYLELVLGQATPFPSLADVGYLLMIPLVLIGLLTLPAVTLPHEGRAKLTVDTLIIMGCIATVSWFAILGPMVAQDTEFSLGNVISFIYPAGDVCFLLAIVGGLARGWFAKHNTIIMLLIAGILLYAFADFGFAFLTTNNLYQDGSPFDIGWPLGILLITYAAIKRGLAGALTASRVGDPAGRLMPIFQRYSPYTLAGGVLLLLFCSDVAKRAFERNVFFALSLITIMLVLLRQFMTLRENERLNGDLRAFSNELESTVTARTRSLRALHHLVSVFSNTSTIEEVCQMGVQELLSMTQGTAAVLFLRQDHDLVPMLCQPVDATITIQPSAEVVNHASKLVQMSFQDEHEVVWITIAEREHVYGFVAILEPERVDITDHATLSAMGAEFGLAYVNQKRFDETMKVEERYRSLIQHSYDMVTVIAPDATVEFLSPSAQRILGWQGDAFVGCQLLDHIHPDDQLHLRECLQAVSNESGESAVLQCRWRHVMGQWVQTETICTNLQNDDKVRGIVLNTRDITERKQFEEALAHQAFHDPLTGLANRALFHNQLDYALRQQHHPDAVVTMMLIDLDNFKKINDTLGHAAGDQVLMHVAVCLQACLGRGDLAARLGGDEFALLLNQIYSEEDSRRLAERIVHDLRQPLVFDGMEMSVGASIGVAQCTEAHDHAEELQRNADVAIYTAKSRGKNTYIIYEPSMAADTLSRLELEAELRHAIVNHEFMVYYQPIVAMTTGALEGFEALVRWQSPKRGLVAPDEFVPLAEETGMIVAIGQWVLQEACRQASQWQRTYPDRHLRICVNLSLRQFQDAHLVAIVQQALQTAQLTPASLTLEITESAVMQDSDDTIAKMRQLKALGVKLAIDDFGTGYSSLSYLRDFPVDVLKIDKSFIIEMHEGEDAQALVQAIVAMGEALHLRVVAEGVETPEQMQRLQVLGQVSGQGYHFAKPMPQADLHRFIQGHIVASNADDQQAA